MRKPTLDSVYEALKWYRIHPVKELKHGVKRHNDSITDGESIFIKILGETNNVDALHRELHAATIFPHAPQPLVDEIIFINYDHNDKRFIPATAWEYITGDTLSPLHVTDTQIGTITEDLFTVYAHPVDSLTFTVNPVNADAIIRRIQRAPTSIPETLLADVIKLVTAFGLTIEDELASTRKHQVLVHGDPHAGNILLTPTGVKLVDYESIKIAPVEFDLACIFQNYTQFHGEDDTYNKFFTQFNDHSQDRFNKPVNEKLLDTVIKFRNISTLTYLLSFQDWDLVDERTQLLLPMIKNGVIPSRLPAQNL